MINRNIENSHNKNAVGIKTFEISKRYEPVTAFFHGKELFIEGINLHAFVEAEKIVKKLEIYSERLFGEFTEKPNDEYATQIERETKNILAYANLNYDQQQLNENFQNLYNYNMNKEALEFSRKLVQRLAGKILVLEKLISLKEQVPVRVLKSDGSVDDLDQGWVLDKKGVKIETGMVTVTNETKNTKKEIPIRIFEKYNSELFNVKLKDESQVEENWSIDKLSCNGRKIKLSKKTDEGIIYREQDYINFLNNNMDFNKKGLK